jgi:hypothetical protein
MKDLDLTNAVVSDTNDNICHTWNSRNELLFEITRKGEMIFHKSQKECAEEFYKIFTTSFNNEVKDLKALLTEWIHIWAYGHTKRPEVEELFQRTRKALKDEKI